VSWPVVDHSHDPKLRSWVAGADDHADFPVQNLPLGVFSNGDLRPRIATAIGDYVLDLAGLSADGHLPVEMAEALRQPSLNALFAAPASARLALRHRLCDLLVDGAQQGKVTPHLYPAGDCQMQLPAQIGDYTDFYVGIHHARNIGAQFRPDNPLLPNYKHIPIGYHGRASSVRASGIPVVRPNGQTKAPDADAPIFGPTRRLDFELELGLWIGAGNDLGRPIGMADAAQHMAGLCLLNDWSARDIQGWEYVPLGPFLAKNFLTSVSPWVITTEALAPFRMAQAPRDGDDSAPLPYLMDAADQAGGALAIELQVEISTLAMRAAGLASQIISRSDARHMYWTFAQMVAHHTSNGCNLQAGDLLGSGTISGPTPDSLGSLMEMSRGGAVPVKLGNGETRSFLADGDEVTLSGRAMADGARSIGFGRCSGVVVRAWQAGVS
jgi:fumarylacetoacetase